MTSTPVKDVSPLLNFIGNQGPAASGIRTESTNSFGDVMSKASYSGKDPASQSTAESSKSKGLEKARTDRTDLHKTTIKESDSKQTEKPDGIVETDSKQAVEQAGNEMIHETAEELGVSEEEVVDAMEELGFGLNALLDADSLTKLALTLSGEESSLVLLTDESLYGKVQNLLQSLEEMTQGLMEDLSMEPEEFEQMLAEMTTEEISENGLPEMPVQKMDEGDENQQKITVTVEEGTQSVELVTDENGNAVKVEDVFSKEEDTGKDTSQDKGKSENGRTGQSFENTNPMLYTLLKNQTQNVDAAFEPVTAAGTPDTQEIMNQILDYIKVQVKPEMDQLEMQLHPESLGTLRVQLTSKGGEVTAQFQVQNESVKTAIESQLTILKDTLREQGIKVEAVEVTVESHAFESNLWQGQKREDSNPYQENKKTPRRINLDALDEEFAKEASEEELLAAEMMKVNGGTVDYTA